jgi:hypothetical protein
VDASTWVAIGAALTGLAALYFNAISVRAAKDQTAIQRQLRIDAAQPYVWADVRTDPESGILLDLAVGNSGPTIATNVTALLYPAEDNRPVANPGGFAAVLPAARYAFDAARESVWDGNKLLLTREDAFSDG